MMKQILDLREQINEIDNQLLKLLKKRFEVCGKIGEFKKENGLSIEDLEREKQLISERVNESNLSKDLVRELYQLIFEESKRLQNDKR